MDAERRMLHAEALLALGHYPEAIAALSNWQGPPDWQAYAQYNLGVTLAKSGRISEALVHLDAALRLRPNPELQRIVDRIRTKK